MVGGAQREHFALGIDLGTSNTVAVIRWPDGRIRPLLFDGQPVMPSLVFLDEGGHLHFGRDAQRMALLDPGRCEPNPKRRIDDRAVLLGDRDVAVVELLAAILRAIAAKAHESVGFLPRAVLTHPAAWGAPRREILQTAAARAGFPPVTLVPEPVAAVRYFTDVMQQPVPAGHAVAVFDFGGGTLDVAVVRNDGGTFSLIGSGGLEDLGGLDVDAALANQLGGVLKSNGNGAIWEQLTAPTSTTERRHRRLFWEDVRGAKEMLSRTTVAPVSVPGLDQALHLTRDELERLATPLLERAVAETSAVIRRSGIAQDKFAGLFLVGGASRIPLVSRLLHTQLGIAPTVLEQPELPVAEGALAEFAPVKQASGVAVPVGAGVAAPAEQSSAAPVSAQPGATSPATPTSPAATSWVAPTPVEAPPPPPKPWWRKPPLLGGAVVLLALALIATMLYVIRGYDERPFVSLRDAFTVPPAGARASSQSDWSIYVGGNRAYHVFPTGEKTVRVAAVDLPSRKGVWRSDDVTIGDGVESVVVRPGYIAIVGEAGYEEGDTQAVRVLDAADGKPAWQTDVAKDDTVWHRGSTIYIYSEATKETKAHDPLTGDVRWSKKDENSWEMLSPRTWADEQGVADWYGDPFQRSLFPDPRVVIISEDRTVHVLDELTGKSEHKLGNVAAPKTGTGKYVATNVAYQGKLFVAEGGNVRMYDLDELSDNSEVFRINESDVKIVGMSPCGETRICVYDSTFKLSVVDFNSSEVAFAKGKQEGLEAAYAVGDRVVAVTEKDNKSRTAIWDADGDEVRSLEGRGVRIDAAGVLVFGAGSLVGVGVRSGAVQDIGSLPDDAEKCVYDADTIACLVEKGMAGWRYREAKN